jgi:hypothetical protein
MDDAGSDVLELFAVEIAEVDAAIGLVERGAAVRVRLVDLPHALIVAGQALARAQAAGITFRVDRRGSGHVTLEIGPRLGPTLALD